MAVGADLLLAVRVTPENSTIKIANVLASKFPDREVPITAAGDGTLETDSAQLGWSSYFRAGYRGAVGFLRRNSLRRREAAWNGDPS